MSAATAWADEQVDFVAERDRRRAEPCTCGHTRDEHEADIGVCRCYRACSCFSFRLAAVKPGDAIEIGAHVVGRLDTGGELRGEVVAIVGRLATVRTDNGRTFTRSLDEILNARTVTK